MNAGFGKSLILRLCELAPTARAEQTRGKIMQPRYQIFAKLWILRRFINNAPWWNKTDRLPAVRRPSELPAAIAVSVFHLRVINWQRRPENVYRRLHVPFLRVASHTWARNIFTQPCLWTRCSIPKVWSVWLPGIVLWLFNQRWSGHHHVQGLIATEVEVLGVLQFPSRRM